MFGGSSGNFTRLVEKATSQLLLEPDWDSTIQICDCIRQADVQPKQAIQTIRKKITQDNPHVSMYALQVLESCVKNCGAVIHEEIATKEFMEFFKDLAKRPDPIKAKILELVQVWAHAFRNSPNYKVVQDTFHLMKAEGHSFPTLKEADAMFKAETAPEWKDGECCHRCRVTFSTFQRKHHCRNCGDIFCAKCSSKTSILPKFGIEREVRVCDGCFDEINASGGPEGKKKSEDGLPSEYVNSALSQQTQASPNKGDQEAQEEEDLQLAIALSKSEAEAKEKEKKRLHSNYASFGSSNNASSKNTNQEAIYAQPSKVTAPVLDMSDMDPELARYLNRNYWQQKQEDLKTSTTQPSAPAAVAETKTTTSGINAEKTEKIDEKLQNGETNPDQEEFLQALRSSIEIFVNRMKSNSARGRSIATDSSVQTLFMTINAMHPQLMKYLSEMEDSRSHFETLQDKLAQLKDAREALDALREEHREKRRREQEELERQRQIQMAHKLDILRQKKQEYLEYQRQLALQRMQEQEREMQMRFEQQKQLTHMRAMQYGYQMYPQQQTFSPAGSAEGSPLHQAHQPGAAPGPYQQGSAVGAPGAPGMQVNQPGQMPPGAMPPQTQAGFVQPGYQGVPQQVPGGYQQVPPGGYQGNMYPGGPMSSQFQAPAGQQPQMNNQMGQPGPQTGQGPPPQGDFPAFNMQQMANSLPNQTQSGPMPPGSVQPQAAGQQQFMPQSQGQYLPPGNQAIPQQQAAPPPQQQQQQQQQQPQQPQQQQAPPSSAMNDLTLISFD